MITNEFVAQPLPSKVNDQEGFYPCRGWSRSEEDELQEAEQIAVSLRKEGGLVPEAGTQTGACDLRQPTACAVHSLRKQC